MADIPAELQEARVFKLHLRNNGLHRFPDAKLQGTGIKIQNCVLQNNFMGLIRSECVSFKVCNVCLDSALDTSNKTIRMLS